MKLIKFSVCAMFVTTQDSLYCIDIRKPLLIKLMLSLSLDRIIQTLMRSEHNCEDLIKCPRPWLFRGRVSNPSSLMHSGSLMHNVMPRTLQNKRC